MNVYFKFYKLNPHWNEVSDVKCKFPSIFMHAFFLICCNFQRVFLSLWSSKWKWMKRDRFVNARLAWPERCGERMGNWNVSGTVSINIHCYRKCNVKRIKTFKKKKHLCDVAPKLIGNALIVSSTILLFSAKINRFDANVCVYSHTFRVLSHKLHVYSGMFRVYSRKLCV